jgi:RNA polymerase sigma-70 factor (ECF subfamily)
MIIEAVQQLTAASRAGVFGRVQCEAAIQSVHVQRPITGRTHHDALATLYRLLALHCPSLGVLVGQAAAMVEAGEPAQAIAALSRLAAADVSSYQPYWVTLASARAAAGDSGSASQALQTAIGLTEDPAIRSFLAASLLEARRA